jgi:hypothetical protein
LLKSSEAFLASKTTLIRSTLFPPSEREGNAVKIAAYLLATLMGLLGMLFLVAAGQGNSVARIVIAVVCLIAAAAIVALVQLKPIQQTHVHHTKLDLTGDVSLEQITCRQCGATLSDKSVRVAAGAVFVHCEYCGSEYQLEEAPKW